MPYYPPRYLFRRHAILRVVKPGETFLEVGPGNMQLTIEVLRHFQRGTLIEYSEDIWEVYRALPEAAQTNLELLVTDFMTLDMTAGFDCAIACEVLEHVADDADFVRKLYAVLNEQGQLILSVPARMKFWSRHDEIVGHLRRYEWDALAQLVTESGFENVQIYAYGFPFVNLLRFPRIWLAKRQAAEKAHLTAVEQTKASGIAQTAVMPSRLGWLVNPTTIYPLAWFSTLFNRFDLSGAYILTASKKSK
ncbi:MAG: methyltransferase domain-containing protein [Chloroflexi bacterium]|nr:methyltransferase domain-containing protein [Chloroflexota bacterium]MBP7043416.1 methyltransferase domain-containing protein [Chloroflexota bacterium]